MNLPRDSTCSAADAEHDECDSEEDDDCGVSDAKSAAKKAPVRMLLLLLLSSFDEFAVELLTVSSTRR